MVLTVVVNLIDEVLELRWRRGEHERGTEEQHSIRDHDHTTHHGIGVAPGIHFGSSSVHEHNTAQALAEPLLNASSEVGDQDDPLDALLVAVRALVGDPALRPSIAGGAGLLALVEAVEKAQYSIDNK